jgi:hypothetical protein
VPTGQVRTVREGSAASAFLVVYLWLKNGHMGIGHTLLDTFYMMDEHFRENDHQTQPAALRCSQCPSAKTTAVVKCILMIVVVSALFRRLVLLSWILCFGDDAWIENTSDMYAPTSADCSILLVLYMYWRANASASASGYRWCGVVASSKHVI